MGERVILSENIKYKDLCLEHLNELVEKIKRENEYQLRKWGIQNRTMFEWMIYLTEEVGELAAEVSENEYRLGSPKKVLAEAIQVATLALKIAEMSAEGFE